MDEKTTDRCLRKRLLSAVAVLFCLLLTGGFCFGVARLLFEQGQEVAISVDTSGEAFTESVTITVSNMLGMDLLIDERDSSCAMLQYWNGEEWEDVCEIRFVQENSASLSAKYGGMYAYLAPGKELQYRLNEQQLEILQSGEYRIAIQYIIEDEYLDYLHRRARQIEEALSADVSDGEESDGPSEESGADRVDGSEASGAEEPAEAVIAQPKTQTFYKSFRFISRADSSGETIDTSSGESSGDIGISVWMK